MSLKSKTDVSKIQYVECDAIINQIQGILSAHHCWPSNSDSNDWSRVMRDNCQWFLDRMWPQVKRKLTVIIGTSEDINERIHLCLFANICNELDLLTSKETQIFEAIIDMFDDMTFGVPFYLKLCHEFNWKMIAAKQISHHRKCLTIVEKCLNECTNEKRFFNRDERINSFSLIQCSLGKAFVCGESIDVPKLEKIFNECSAQLKELLNNNEFQLCLSLYNSIAAEVLSLAISKDNDIQLQWPPMIEEFMSLIMSINDIQINDKHLLPDITLGREYIESISIVSNEFKSQNIECQIPGHKMVSDVIQRIPMEMESIRLSLFENVIITKSEGFKSLINIIIKHCDAEKHLQIFKLINPMDVNDAHFINCISERIMKYDDGNGNLFIELLILALKSAPKIDLRKRCELFGVTPLSRANINEIKKLFNQLTVNVKSQSEYHLTKELIIGAFLDPMTVYELMINQAIFINKTQSDFISQLLCTTFKDLSLFKDKDETEFGFNTLMQILIQKLMETPKPETVDSIVNFVKSILKYDVIKDDTEEFVLPIYEFFFSLTVNQCLSQYEHICCKLMLMKQIIEIEDHHHSWIQMKTNVIPILCYLLQYLDYFWNNPVKKQITIDILNEILINKMKENVSDDDIMFIEQFLKKIPKMNASSHFLYLAYLEMRLPVPLSQLFSFKDYYHDQLLHLAVTTKDFKWITDVHPDYNRHWTDIKIASSHIIKSLTNNQFERLFYFLRQYFYNIEAIAIIKYAIFKQEKSVNTFMMISNFVPIVTDVVKGMKEYKSNYDQFNDTEDDECDDDEDKDDDYYKIKNAVKESKMIVKDYGIIFKLMASFDFLLLTNDIHLPLKELLTFLGNEMKLNGVNPVDFYECIDKIPRLGKDVICSVFGDDSLKMNKNFKNEILLMPTI